MTKATRYFIPAQAIELSYEIKRSRFIAYIAHSANTEMARHIISQQKKRYADARHHCWAFIACPPLSASAIRFSDDGEPSGCAGKPILNVLQYSHYGEIICVVSRYFGGIKLGAGGLIRAYSSSTQTTIEQLHIKEVVTLTSIKIQFDYPFESSIRHYLELQKMTIQQVDYLNQITFHLQVEQLKIPVLMQQARNICKGQVHFIHANNENLNNVT